MTLPLSNVAVLPSIETTVAIPTEIVNTNKMGYFEVYDDFYTELKNNRGAIILFTISRDGSNCFDTFGGNFSIAGVRIGLADPPEDGMYTSTKNISGGTEPYDPECLIYV